MPTLKEIEYLLEATEQSQQVVEAIEKMEAEMLKANGLFLKHDQDPQKFSGLAVKEETSRKGRLFYFDTAGEMVIIKERVNASR